MIRVYCDWNDRIDEKRFALGCAGALKDIRNHAGILKEGMRVLFYQTDELEAEGTLEFDEKKKLWIAVPDFSTKRYIGCSTAEKKKAHRQR